jgi:hypothetical protein
MSEPIPIPSDWKAQSEAAIRAIDPTFDEPIYLLSAAEANCNIRALGISHALMSLDFPPTLECLGLWRGPGFCTILRPERFWDFTNLAATAIHEYLHDVQLRRLRAAALTLLTCRGETQTQSLTLAPTQARVLLYEPMTSQPADHRPWSGHGGDFTRLVIHASYRANCRGWPMDDFQIFHSTRYRLSALRGYSRLLGDEPQRLDGLSLTQVAALPAPPEFLEFAEHDIQVAERRWIARKERLAASNAHDAGATVSTHGAEGATP